jgi:hypothetical protein
MIAWFMGTQVGRAIGIAIAAVAFAAVVYWRIFTAGRKSAQGDAAIDVAKRTRMATQARVEAMRPVTPKEEANDPHNRDRR